MNILGYLTARAIIGAVRGPERPDPPSESQPTGYSTAHWIVAGVLAGMVAFVVSAIALAAGVDPVVQGFLGLGAWCLVLLVSLGFPDKRT